MWLKLINNSFGDVDQCFRYCLVWFVSLFEQDPPGGFSSQEKTVSLKKEPRLSLGITIAGGRDCRSRLPVYITSVQPVGCLHRDGTIKRGTRQHLVICDGLWGVVFVASATTTHQQSKIQTNSGCVPAKLEKTTFCCLQLPLWLWILNSCPHYS